jgi:beta-galactosidase
VEADGHAVAIINVSASDSEGRAVPTAHAQVDFEISASAQLLGVGNGNPTSHELEQAPRRRLFNGKAQLILRSHGEASTLMVRAHAQGLDSGILEIQLPVRAAILPSIGGSTAQSDGHGKLNPVDGSL